jgi:uncharacterized GH25 family protein
MRARSRRAQVTALAALTVTLTLPLSAHDFWIEPSAFQAAPGETLRIHLRVGEHFAGEPVVRNSPRIERFVAVGPSGEREVPGRDGIDPAGVVRVDAPGVWAVGYRSRPGPVQLAAGAFDAYLREEGLERIIDARAARGESRLPGRERFSRSVKALVRVGTGDTTGFDRVLGLTLELVPEADPMRAGTQVPMRLLHRGRPLAAALVVGYRKLATTTGAVAEAFRARSDRDGRVTVPVEAGTWLLKAVHMERAEGGDADWESVWTALTFQVPSGDPRRTTESRAGTPPRGRRP